jgi:WD40 repeat protein
MLTSLIITLIRIYKLICQKYALICFTIGAVDGRVMYFQINTKRVLHQFQHSVSTDASRGEEALSVECVALCKQQGSGSMKWAASGGADGLMKIWDLNSGVLRCACEHSRSSVVALQWHDTAHHLIFTAALDYLIRVWDARDGKDND